MRRAVSLAEGFWYQHSFISFTRAERVCEEQRDRKLKKKREREREFWDQCGCQSPVMFKGSESLRSVRKLLSGGAGVLHQIQKMLMKQLRGVCETV